MPGKPAILLVLLTSLPAALAGQRAAPAMASWSATSPTAARNQPPSQTPPSFGDPKDYRWEGLAIGGLAVGIFGAYGAIQMSNDSDNGGSGDSGSAAFFGFLVGAVVGGVVGGLIGGAIPK